MQLFQGEKPAHDFLSLHTGGGASSPVQHRDTHNSTQVAAYDLGVHSTLKPLKVARQRGAGAIAMASSGLEADSEEHVLPGGVGTFSIRRQVPSAQPRGDAASHGGVRGAFAPGLHGSRTEGAHGAESGARAHSGPSTMWQDSGADRTTKEGRSSGSSADQGPSTPRSKHSATEQRRRTKINDRKARLKYYGNYCLTVIRRGTKHLSFSRRDVIEYIKFLQEKVQRYESTNPERNHEDSKSMPWAKVYYRSCWKNTQNISQVQGGGLPDSTQDVNNEQCGSRPTTVVPVFSTQNNRETSTDDSPSQKVANTAQNWEKNSTSKELPWLSMSTSDSGTKPLNKTERETVHGDTRSLSNAYSQGLLHRLTEALKRSGVDPSQANISVEINMDKRDREHSNTHDNSKTTEGDECNHVAKRLRCDTS
ncbi:hypothetical protein EJB05_19855 [Eragrostis curvula]|uniref:BHLH domain-containing protein n=1 Tax=Eragrostis curvula TaxID=38414 RepID=A0A5J9UZ49_9POAL|nr:hypothetical protein EJB05_19855 [Eragrostis curvula]